jgi:hypothetical protein
MPAVLVTMGKLLASTAMTIFSSLLTSSMVEWAFWWLGEKLVKKSDATWDNELLARMRNEREKSK